ncbi:MAG: MBL fold metallo-hydrolase [Chloroflexi bacterium]|nr:MBL fold metallo-hydrolase [Chloroflexota bacterium]
MPSSAVIDGILFTRFVQATFSIQGSGRIVYLDPHKLTVRAVGADRADLVLVTHPHFDHMDPEAIQMCGKQDTVVVANAPCAKELQGKVPNVVSIREGESTTQKGVDLRAVPGYNTHHKRTRAEQFNVGFVFTLAGKTIYHAGDTGKVPEMAKLGAIDVALVPIGGIYTMDEAEAAEAVRDMIKPRHVIPMHYGYATGGDPEKFRTLVGNAAQVHVLEPVFKIKAG